MSDVALFWRYACPIVGDSVSSDHRTASRSFVFRWPWFPDDGLVTTVRVTM
jgi:hypothetical protein